MISLWTPARRRAIKKRAADCAPDHAEVERIAWSLARDWGPHATAWRDLPLAPIVEHKLYRYAVRLRDTVDFVLRGVAATDAAFPDPPPRLLLGPGAPHPLSHVAAHRLQARGTRCCTLPRLPRPLDLHRPAEAQTAHMDCRLHGLAPTTPPTAPALPCPVLLVASTANYLNPMIPLLRALCDTGTRPALLLPRDAQHWPQFRALPPAVHAEFLEDCFDPAAAAAWHAVHTAMNDDPPFGAHWKVQGVPLRPLIATELDRFRSLHPSEAAATIEIAHAAFTRLGTRVLLCARQRRALEIAFVRAAHARNLKTAMIIHGHFAFDAHDAAFIYGSFDALDRVIVWGEDQRDRLRRANIPRIGLPLREEQILIAGNPAWDDLARMPCTPAHRAATRAALARQLGLDPHRPWITLATQDITLSQYRDIIAALHTLDAQLLIKIHPAENPAAYALAESPRNLRLLAPNEIELHPLLAASDLLITYSSTVNLEALLLGTPVLTAALRPEVRAHDRLLRLDDFGLPCADTPETLRHAVETLLPAATHPPAFPPERCRAIAAHFLANAEDGAAAQRAAAAIQALIETTADPASAISPPCPPVL